MKTTFVRAVAALATALACLVASAIPASADTITSGRLWLGSVTATRLIHMTAGTCPVGTFDVDITATTASIPAMALTRQVAGGTHVAVITRTGGSTGINMGGSLSAIGLSLNIEIFTLAATTTCTADTRACEFDVDLTFSGTFTDGFFDTVYLTNGFVTPTITPPCDSPYSTFDLAGSTGLYAVV